MGNYLNQKLHRVEYRNGSYHVWWSRPLFECVLTAKISQQMMMGKSVQTGLIIISDGALLWVFQSNFSETVLQVTPYCVFKN